MFSLLRYELIARRTKAQNGTELGQKLRIQMNEMRVKYRRETENDMFPAWRMKVTEDIGYSGWKVNNGLEMFEK